MLSFTTSGNFIDFKYTEDNYPFYAHQLMRLHNTSRAITWAFGDNPDIIDFTIDDLIYNEIPVPSIYFDGVQMSAQADFQTGIEAMFTGYAGGGGGTTIYTGDGALAGDRTVDLNGKFLKVQQGGNNFLSIDPTTGNETVVLRAFNNTGSGNYGSFESYATSTTGAFALLANFDDGNTKQPASILANNDGTATSLQYIADTHTFNGPIINPDLVAADFADDTAAATGLIPVGGLYHTSGIVKVRLT